MIIVASRNGEVGIRRSTAASNRPGETFVVMDARMDEPGERPCLCVGLG